MFAIYCTTPIYDNRDGYAGSKTRRVSHAYETPGLPHRLSLEMQFECDGNEVEYFVADAADHRKRLPPPPIEWEDIPW